MKPTIQNFEFAYTGGFYDENDNYISQMSDPRFVHEATQSGYGNYEGYDEIIVIYDTLDNEFWGLEVSHDSWNEESFYDKGYTEADIDRVEKRPITETRWTFE